MSEQAQSQRKVGPLLRFAFDLGPLLIFFAAYQIGKPPNQLFIATGAFMVAVLAALAAGYAIER
ncbi:MAG TPA: septation protein IspZ, partial [Rhizomicrobium sp.]